MTAVLRAWLAGLEPRERRVLLAGAGALAVLVLFGGVLLPLNAALTTATQANARRRDDLEWMRVNAAELRAGAAQLRVPTGEPPLVLIDRSAREAGLSAALRGTQPSGSGGVQVQLQGAPFDTLMIWLATLDRRYGFSVGSITVDRGTRTGTVDANVTFTPPAH